MRVSAKTEYACLAMLQLAISHAADEPVRIRDIATAHGIPQRFLVQILLQLKAAGLVTSTRGAAGGYQLVRLPEEVSLAEIMAVIEGPRDADSAPETAPINLRRSAGGRALRGAWAEVDAVQQGMLASVTLADLVERAQGRNESMYYI